MLNLAGRTAVVTGGSRGIGRATAVLLARCGARVGIGYHTNRRAAEETLRLAREAAGLSAAGAEAAAGVGPPSTSGAEAIPAPWAEAGDLSREEDVDALFARADREFGASDRAAVGAGPVSGGAGRASASAGPASGGLDIFIGNAGVWNVDPLPLQDLVADDWRCMLETNLTSVFLTARAAARRLSEGGRIVLVSSTAGQRGEAGHSHYAASKGAIISFVKSLAVELGPRGITVNAVAPGWVDTDMSAGILRTDAIEAVERDIPLRRVATAEDVAGPIVFLAGDLAAHVTGEVLNVNGGSVLCG